MAKYLQGKQSFQKFFLYLLKDVDLDRLIEDKMLTLYTEAMMEYDSAFFPKPFEMDETKILIVAHASRKPYTVEEFAEMFGITKFQVKGHLLWVIRRGYIISRKEKNRGYYTTTPLGLKFLAETIQPKLDEKEN